MGDPSKGNMRLSLARWKLEAMNNVRDLIGDKIEYFPHSLDALAR